MKRIKNLNAFQKLILCFLMLMIASFSIIYPLAIANEGFSFMNHILVPSSQNGNDIFTGKIDGKVVSFTVSSDKTVTYKYGDKIYEPYKVITDKNAVPNDYELGKNVIFVGEVYKGDEIIFRGVADNTNEFLTFIDENGEMSFATSTKKVDENEQFIDFYEPNIQDIIKVASNPEFSHKGEWGTFIGGVILCILTALSILFADEIFRFQLSFQIRSSSDAEPSDFELGSRYVAWTILPLLVLFFFIVGLN